MKTWKAWTGPEIQRLVNMVKGGKGAAEISKALSRPADSIYFKARESGYPVGRSKGAHQKRYSRQQIEQCKTLIGYGLTAKEIQEEVPGISKSYLSNLKRGLSPTKR